MAFGTKVDFDAVREISFGSISASYTAIGTALTDHARLFCISNSTDVEVYISFDGVTNHLRLAANSFKLFDLTANEVQEDGFFLSVGTSFYVKRVSGAPASGAVWVEVLAATGGV